MVNQGPDKTPPGASQRGASQRGANKEQLDPRCDRIESGLDAMLDQTAPRETPAGLEDRVYQATLPFLEIGRGTASSAAALPSVARLALAACLAVAVVGAFWLVGQSPVDRGEDVTLVFDAPADAPKAADRSMGRFLGLQRVHDLDYGGAVGDLEQVVWAIQNGAASGMILAPGETPLEAVENELDSVRVVSQISG